MVMTLRSRLTATAPQPARRSGRLRPPSRRAAVPLALAAAMAGALISALVLGPDELGPGRAMVFAAAFGVLLALAFGLLFLGERSARLREAERFRDFAEVTPDWFWEMDEALRFTYMSPGGLQGLGRRTGEVIGRAPQEIPPDGVAAEQWQAHLADLRAHRPFRDFRLRRVGGDGEVRHISVSGTPVFDGRGRFRGYRGTSRDITAEVEREQRSQGLEQRLFDAIENFPEAIVLWGADGRLVHANSHYLKLVGPLAEHAKPGVLIQDLRQRAAQMGIVALPDGANALIGSRPVEPHGTAAPSEHALRDGRWVLITARRTADGGVLTIYTDITAQKQAQLAAQTAAAELREKQRQLDAALDNIAQGITLYDAEQRLVLANRRYGDIFRLPADLLRPGVTLREIMEASVRHGNYAADQAERVIAERLALAARRERAQLQQRLTDGRIIELTHNPLPEGGAVVTFSDVTDRDHASRALLAAKEAAESANRAKSQFLAKMSHELRTPLNAVLGFSEIIRDLAFGRDALDRYAAYAQDIHFSGEHLLRVINDILDMSKIEAGQTKMSDDLVDLPEQIDQALGMLSTSARRANVTVVSDVPPGLPRLRADRRSLLQVLLNLLSNAIKFSHDGDQVTIAARVAGDGELEIAVADGGVGIPVQDQARIFEPFFQAGGRARNLEGTGLGLSICKSIMDLHGGSIRLDSNVEHGTRAVIRFPVSRVVRT